MSDESLIPQDKTLKQFSDRVVLIRNFSMFVLIMSIAQIVLAIILPDVLTQTLKIWVLSVIGCFFVGLVVVHVLARHDTVVILFINFISPYISGIISGVALALIIFKIEK